jgi:phage terminase large subunit-like protein
MASRRSPPALGYSGATSEKQAWEVFRPARLMAQKTPALLERFGIQLGAKNLHMLGNGSRLEPVIGKPGDGASPSCAIVDEYHEHDTDELFDTMQTGMGAREQPLMLVITTAGSNIAGPCHALQGDVQKVLNGVVENDELFGIVYTIDEGDDWTSEAALRKANPNYDVSVGADFLASRQREAVQNSRKQSIFKTKHLNVWVQARDAWMNMEWWNRQADPDLSLDQFKGEECVVGLDLSAKLDLASTAKVFKRVIDGSEHFYVFGRHYLPETTAEDPEKQHYTAWVADGHLIATDGEVTDFAAIEADLGDDIGCFQVAEIAYDPWGATQLAQRLQAEHGATVVEFPQNTKNLSEPMKWAEALVKDGRLHHDGDPVLTWAVSNVTAKEDANENVFPRKERAENKIDPAVAMIMALGRAMAQQGSVSGSYLERDELLVL